MTKASSTTAGGAKTAVINPAVTRTAAPGGSASPRAAAREAQAERLSAALKDNLRRRKAQARARTVDAAPAAGAAERPEHEPRPVRDTAQDQTRTANES
jgi:hypothetical protein